MSGTIIFKDPKDGTLAILMNISLVAWLDESKKQGRGVYFYSENDYDVRIEIDKTGGNLLIHQFYNDNCRMDLTGYPASIE